MIYCDLSLNGTVLFSGAPCLNAVAIRPASYIGLVGGRLSFLDTQGDTDPMWTGLGSRYILLWLPNSGDPGATIPLKSVPSQQFDIALGNFSYTITIYENSPS
jgi:hypothetical protein